MCMYAFPLTTSLLLDLPPKLYVIILYLQLIMFPLEKAIAPHSSTLAWKIPWMEEPSGLQSMGSLKVGHDWATSLSLFLSCTGEGNGNPLQCSCLENPRDGGAWWAAIYGVAQSWTWLKWLSSNRLLDSSHSDWHEMVPYCGFDLHFSDNQWCWASFHVFVSHLYVFFGEMSI